MNQIINHPIAHFIYGCIWFGVGLAYWHTQLLDNLGLIGIFITGIHLVLGFFYLSMSYDYIIHNSVRQQYKKDMIELENDRIKFNEYIMKQRKPHSNSKAKK